MSDAHLAICPGGPELPDLNRKSGTFYIAPPLRYTHESLTNRLRDGHWSLSSPTEGLIGISVSSHGLEPLLRELEDALSLPEMEDTNAVFVEAGRDPDLTVFPLMRPLSVWIARADGRWLADLIREERVRVLHQPIVRAENPRDVAAHECLLRGLTPEGKDISPGRLFQAAEETRLVFHLDRLARVAAVRQSRKRGVEGNLFINFRPTSIYHPAFCLRTTMQAVDEAGLDPERIVFEVVESESVADNTHLRHIVEEYRNGGFGIALDDLGSGYGSLNLFKDLEPDYVKIDMDLVRGAHLDGTKASIIRAIIDIARDTGTTVIAEGIEERPEYEWLAEAGVDLIQGFYFGRPE